MGLDEEDDPTLERLAEEELERLDWESLLHQLDLIEARLLQLEELDSE